MDIIPEVSNNATNINSAEFVRLTVYNDYSNTANTTTYTFSTAYTSETIDGVVYSPLGGLLSVGVQQRDLRVTSADTSISLSGVDGNNIYIVLGTKIKGSEIEITRGFYNNNYVLTNTYPRFTGIVTSYNIAEDRIADTDTFTVTVNASSYKTVLENRLAGRKTNEQSWQVFNSTDSSMNNMYSLSGRKFDFGKKPTASQPNPSAATSESQVNTETNVSSGGGY